MFLTWSSAHTAKLNLWKEGLPSLSDFIGCIVGTTLYMLVRKKLINSTLVKKGFSLSSVTEYFESEKLNEEL